ncbi:MAG: hypothetical protein U0271_20985 [Polyangiaceae bacterium]
MPDSPAQIYRIKVPTPEAELVMGEGESGFVGIMGRVPKGGVFFGAGGFPFGIPSADSSYEGFKRAQTTLTVAVGALSTVSLLMRTAYMGSQACGFSALINGLALGAGAGAGAVNAIMFGGTPPADGAIGLYGDSTVAIASPLTVSATGGVAASLNGTVCATVNGLLTATVNGITAGVFAAYSATVSASESNFIGDGRVVVAARQGVTSIEGASIRLGHPSVEAPGMAYSGFRTGHQAATKRVDIHADDVVAIEAGGMPDMVQGSTSKIIAGIDRVHMQAEGAAVTVDGRVTARAGRSVLALAQNRIKLFLAKKPIQSSYHAVMVPAENAWNTARAAADTVERNLSEYTWTTMIGGVAGHLAGIGAGIAAMKTQSNGGAKAGVLGATAVAGAAAGALGTYGVLKLIEKKLTDEAQKAARDAADSAYKAAYATAQQVVATDISLQSSMPVPKIDITDESLVLSVGLSKIKITATGIEIQSGPGCPVTVNGQQVGNLVPSALEVS